jgi:hypothetical protein
MVWSWHCLGCACAGLGMVCVDIGLAWACLGMSLVGRGLILAWAEHMFGKDCAEEQWAGLGMSLAELGMGSAYARHGLHWAFAGLYMSWAWY